MYIYHYKRHWATRKEQFDTLADAKEHVAAMEASNFEYEFPLKITTESGEVVWDNNEIRRKMGLPPESE